MKPVYRRSDDHREFGKNVLGTHFLDVIANHPSSKEIQEARKRIVTLAGRAQYIPSEEYKRYKQQQDLLRLRVRRQH